MESTSLCLFNEITTHGVVQRYSTACCVENNIHIEAQKQPRIRNLSVEHETATY